MADEFLGAAEDDPDFFDKLPEEVGQLCDLRKIALGTIFTPLPGITDRSKPALHANHFKTKYIYWEHQ